MRVEFPAVWVEQHGLPTVRLFRDALADFVNQTAKNPRVCPTWRWVVLFEGAGGDSTEMELVTAVDGVFGRVGAADAAGAAGANAGAGAAGGGGAGEVGRSATGAPPMGAEFAYGVKTNPNCDGGTAVDLERQIDWGKPSLRKEEVLLRCEAGDGLRPAACGRRHGLGQLRARGCGGGTIRTYWKVSVSRRHPGVGTRPRLVSARDGVVR